MHLIKRNNFSMLLIGTGHFCTSVTLAREDTFAQRQFCTEGHFCSRVKKTYKIKKITSCKTIYNFIIRLISNKKG